MRLVHAFQEPTQIVSEVRLAVSRHSQDPGLRKFRIWQLLQQFWEVLLKPYISIKYSQRPIASTGIWREYVVVSSKPAARNSIRLENDVV